MIPALIAPLLSQGLGLLANAVMAKGKDWVEERTGVKLDQKLSPEDTLKLKQFELEHEEELMKLRLEEKKLDITELGVLGGIAKNDADNVSDRWKADMGADSWLSKNIRPMSLIALFAGYFLFALLSAFGYNANAGYVELLGQWGMLAMGAYFGGRTWEKLAEIKGRK